MQKQQFKVSIGAPRSKVWDILWNDTSYQEWTSVFSEGSHTKTDWKKGNKVFFLNGNGEGMVATIAENIPNEFMSIRHLGTVRNGIEDTDSAETKAWAGAMENYTLKEVNGKTELTVDIDVTDEFKDYFMDTWPKALERIQQLSEKK